MLHDVKTRLMPTPGLPGLWSVLVVTIVSLALTLAGCDSGRPVEATTTTPRDPKTEALKQEGFTPLYFRVEESLLGESLALADQHFSMRAPAGFEAIADEDRSRLEAAMQTSSLKLHHALKDRGSEAMVTVCWAPTLTTWDATWKAVEASQNAESSIADQEPRITRFAYQGMRIGQLLERRQGMQVWRMWVHLPDRGAVLIDFVVPIKDAKDMARFVESSLGSMKDSAL